MTIIDERNPKEIRSPSKASPSKKKKIIEDVPLSKEMRTPYTIIIKNSGRKVL